MTHIATVTRSVISGITHIATVNRSVISGMTHIITVIHSFGYKWYGSYCHCDSVSYSGITHIITVTLFNLN